MRVNIEEAIQEDVSEEKKDEQVENPRLETMEAIVAENRKADATFEDDSLEAKTDDLETTEDDLEEEETLEAKEDDDEEELVTLTADGKEIQVEMSKIIDAGKRTYQKETTADARLEEASERQREIDRLEAELNERQNSLVTLADGEKIDIGKEFTAAMFEDEEKAADLLNKVAARMQVLEDTLALEAQKKVLSAEEEQQKIVNYYHNTYDEIASDQDMHDLLVVRTRSHQKADPSLSPQEAIDAAAKDVNRFYGNEDDSASEQKTTPVRGAKRAGAKKRDLQKPPPKPQTTDEILAEMQVARGRRPTL